MDGRSGNRLNIRKSTLSGVAVLMGSGVMLAAAAMLMLPVAARGQAMGQASIDGGPVAPEGIAPPLVAPAPEPAPAKKAKPDGTVAHPVAPRVATPASAGASAGGSDSSVPASGVVNDNGFGAGSVQIEPVQIEPARIERAGAGPAVDLSPLGPILMAAEPKAAVPVSTPPAASVVKPVAAAAPAEVEKPVAGSASKSPAGKSSTIEDEPIRGHSDGAAAGSEKGIVPPATGVQGRPVADSGGTSSASSGWYSQFKGLAQLVGAMVAVIGLILILKGLAKKFVPGAKAAGGKGVIEILARHPVSKNQAIVLVRIGSQIVALNQGKESSESVLVINDATEVARIIGQIEGKKAHSSQAGFTRLLANARVDLEEGADAEPELAAMTPENLDEQLEEMAAAKRQLMELRQHVRTVRDRLPKS